MDKFNNKKITFWDIIGTAYRLAVSMSKYFFWVTVLIYAVKGATYGFAAFAMQSLFASVENILSGSGSVKAAVLMVIFLGGIYILQDVFTALGMFASSVLGGRNNRTVFFWLHKKYSEMEPVLLEDMSVQDDINKADVGAGTTQTALMAVLTLCAYNLAYLIIMSVYLYSLKPIFIVFLVIAFVPQYLGELLKTFIVSKNEDYVAPKRRVMSYYDTVITSKEYFKETRILGGYKYFLKRFVASLKELNRIESKVQFKILFIDFISQLFVLLGYCAILIILVRYLVIGEIAVSAFAGVFASIGMMFDFMDDILWRVGLITTNMGTAHNFIRFLRLPNRGGTAAVPDKTQGITVSDISFTYPGAAQPSINNLSIDIKPGEKIAIVGENGAGKTTLVRLMLGIYKPELGSVTVQGMDTRRTAAESLFSGVSGVFQRYQRYPMTLSDNIRISDFGSAEPPDCAAEKAGVHVTSAVYPQGYETMLSRDFGGTELSGGQWQWVAIARGLYRNHDIIVLDEPTSAIDPLDESAIYKKFMELSENKTSVIVTHRLGSAKIADRIIVMSDGRIAEMGSHNNLVARGGLYAQMYHAQAEWYER